MTIATGWVCTNCGSDGAEPIVHPKLGQFTQLDPRYAIGYCDVCSVANPAKPRKTPRPTNTLIQNAHFDRVAFVTKKEKTKLRELIQSFANGKSNVQMSDPDLYQMVTLFDKYPIPNYFIQPWVREKAENYAKVKYTPAESVKKRKKRGR